MDAGVARQRAAPRGPGGELTRCRAGRGVCAEVKTVKTRWRSNGRRGGEGIALALAWGRGAIRLKRLAHIKEG